MKPAASSFRRRQRARTQARRMGFLQGHFSAPDDFNSMGSAEIERMFVDGVRENGDDHNIPDLADAAERTRLSASAIQAFVNIVRKWQISEEQARGLLGADAPTYRAWQADPHGTTLDQEAIIRISLAIGIYRALHICHGEKLADQWVTLQNSGQLFAGQTPIDYMIERGQAGMQMIRRLLDSRSAGN